jgi:hypothetical protein
MLAVACLMAIGMNIGVAGIFFSVIWLKCKLTQLRKIKTGHTV